MPIGTYYALEVVNADQYKGLNLYRVTLRASAGPIFPTDQLSWNGHILNVAGAVTDPFNIMIEVDATEKGQQ